MSVAPFSNLHEFLSFGCTSSFVGKNKSIPLSSIIKEYSIPKLKFCHHLFTIMLFQTCMTFFTAEPKRRYLKNSFSMKVKAVQNNNLQYNIKILENDPFDLKSYFISGTFFTFSSACFSYACIYIMAPAFPKIKLLSFYNACKPNENNTIQSITVVLFHNIIGNETGDVLVCHKL